MFTIGKFSQLVRVSPRMLQHYEKCGLFYAAEIQASIDEEFRIMEQLQMSLARIEKGNYTTTCQNVVLKQIPRIKVLSIREIVPNYSYQKQLWRKLYSFIEKNNLYPLLGANVLAIYHETEYKESNVDIVVAITV